jgi:hypothetical protein
MHRDFYTEPHTKASPPPDSNIAAAARFLALLDPAAERFEFRTFDDNVDRYDANLTKTFHGPLDQHANTLRRLNRCGAGVFVTINETDGKGRAAENIVRVRAVFVDLDGAPLEPVMSGRCPPHIVVESSPERWHAYWLVKGMALEDFAPVQRALIRRFDSDPKVHDLPRVMRLPGFVHAKVKDGIAGEPFVSRIIRTTDGPAYPASYFDRIPTEIHTPGEQHDVTPMDEWKAAAALEVIPNDDLDWGDWNRVGMATWRSTGASHYGFEAFDRWSAKSTKYNPARTLKIWRGYNRSPPHSLGLGTLIMLADQADPEWRERFEAEVLAMMIGCGHD